MPLIGVLEHLYPCVVVSPPAKWNAFLVKCTDCICSVCLEQNQMEIHGSCSAQIAFILVLLLLARYVLCLYNETVKLWVSRRTTRCVHKWQELTVSDGL